MTGSLTIPVTSQFLDETRQLVAEAVQQVFDVPSATAEEVKTWVGYSTQSTIAHAAFPCHNLAKILRQAPKQIAFQLCSHLSGISSTRIREVSELNGYLNFTFNLELCLQESFARVREGRLYVEPLLASNEREKVIVEFSQPNTHQALHIGHLRNTVYGDAVCNLLSAVGHRVVRATYPGDLGAHIAKTLWFLKKFKMEEFPKQPDSDWLGHVYAEADQYLKSIEGTDDEIACRMEISKVFQQLEAQKGEYQDLYLDTREWSLNAMHQVYDWLGVRFDVWYYESECDHPSRDFVKGKFEEGFFVLSQGAIGIDLNPYDLGFAIYLRSDGTGLYLTKDLELLNRKFSDPEITSSIYVVDSRQKLHFQQLFKTAELMGYPQAGKSLHLAYESVTDEKGAPFSSRSLNAVSIDSLKLGIRNRIIEQYLKQFMDEWGMSGIVELADQIALGAIKYGMLKVDRNRIIQFILEDWIKLDGDTGPYLQYAYARCANIRKKVGEAAPDFSVQLTTEAEHEVVLHLEKFNTFLLQAATQYRPSTLCAYLYDLARIFSRFYQDCPIKDVQDISVRNTRLALVTTVQSVLKRGMDLLGIPTPERM